jgi:hypothetical protein
MGFWIEIVTSIFQLPRPAIIMHKFRVTNNNTDDDNDYDGDEDDDDFIIIIIQWRSSPCRA